MLKPFRLNLDSDDMRECGRVAVWSSLLDAAMEVAMWLLLDLTKPEARMLSHGMNADRKRQWLETLAKSKRLTVPLRASLEQILAEAKTTFPDRNIVIHGLWHIGPDGKPWAAKYSEKGKLTFHKRLDRPLIHEIGEKLKILAMRLADWNEAFEPGAMSSSFPKISSPAKNRHGA